VLAPQIRTLRAKLKIGENIIENVRGEGFRLATSTLRG
jgi:DNA-binding response OmpR family regulator